MAPRRCVRFCTRRHVRVGACTHDDKGAWCAQGGGSRGLGARKLGGLGASKLRTSAPRAATAAPVDGVLGGFEDAATAAKAEAAAAAKRQEAQDAALARQLQETEDRYEQGGRAPCGALRPTIHHCKRCCSCVSWPSAGWPPRCLHAQRTPHPSLPRYVPAAAPAVHAVTHNATAVTHT